MKRKIETVGIVIADKDEYIHIEKALPEAVRSDICGLVSHTAKVGRITVRTILCGIGKVCAAAGAALLAPGCDLLISAGLSGGFGAVSKYDIVAGTSFTEHDFDLTAIGRALGEKPGQSGPYRSDAELVKDLCEKFPFVKTGAFVTGDSFISTAEKHDFLEKKFAPVACDMETAAVAHTASLFRIPFMAVRMISDGADDSSADTYTDTLCCDRADGWIKLTCDWIKSL